MLSTSLHLEILGQSMSKRMTKLKTTLASFLVSRIKMVHWINSTIEPYFFPQIQDLLNPSRARDSLPVRWARDRGFYVENLFFVECDTVDDLIAVLEEGN